MVDLARCVLTMLTRYYRTPRALLPGSVRGIARRINSSSTWRDSLSSRLVLAARPVRPTFRIEAFQCCTPTCDQTCFLGNCSLTSILDRTSWREDQEYSVQPSVAPEEIADGIWNVYFGPLKLGRLSEKHRRIEDAFGRVKRPL